MRLFSSSSSPTLLVFVSFCSLLTHVVPVLGQTEFNSSRYAHWRLPANPNAQTNVTFTPPYLPAALDFIHQSASLPLLTVETLNSANLNNQSIVLLREAILERATRGWPHRSQMAELQEYGGFHHLTVLVGRVKIGKRNEATGRSPTECDFTQAHLVTTHAGSNVECMRRLFDKTAKVPDPTQLWELGLQRVNVEVSQRHDLRRGKLQSEGSRYHYLGLTNTTANDLYRVPQRYKTFKGHSCFDLENNCGAFAAWMIKDLGLGDLKRTEDGNWLLEKTELSLDENCSLPSNLSPDLPALNNLPRHPPQTPPHSSPKIPTNSPPHSSAKILADSPLSHYKAMLRNQVTFGCSSIRRVPNVGLLSHARALSTTQAQAKNTKAELSTISDPQRRSASHVALTPSPHRITSNNSAKPSTSTGSFQTLGPLFSDSTQDSDCSEVRRKATALEDAVKTRNATKILDCFMREFPSWEKLGVQGKGKAPILAVPPGILKQLIRSQTWLSSIVVLLPFEEQLRKAPAEKKNMVQLRKVVKKVLPILLQSGLIRGVSPDEFYKCMFGDLKVERKYNFAPCPLDPTDTEIGRCLDTNILTNIVGAARRAWITSLDNPGELICEFLYKETSEKLTTVIGAIREFRRNINCPLPDLLMDLPENSACLEISRIMKPFNVDFKKQDFFRQDYRNDLIKREIAKCISMLPKGSSQKRQMSHLRLSMSADIELAVASSTDSNSFITADGNFAGTFGRFLWDVARIKIVLVIIEDHPARHTKKISSPTDSTFQTGLSTSNVLRKAHALIAAAEKNNVIHLRNCLVEEFPYCRRLVIEPSPDDQKLEPNALHRFAKDCAWATGMTILLLLENTTRKQEKERKNMVLLRKTVKKTLITLVKAGVLRSVTPEEFASVMYGDIKLERKFYFPPCPLGPDGSIL
ncbi:hypothetical protein BJ508DRAFT_321267 [Ascobolus immersus RN42]|uniref:Uncharacterized protein n=1 Tax=Ascobolus immersus RN42 TaxID=1160509 RepID=A0A3N4IR14_ASCIM|nr:hypothetical protein BJ508DRAFT_321267 [Ascobolus immersus RN42]